VSKSGSQPSNSKLREALNFQKLTRQLQSDSDLILSELGA